MSDALILGCFLFIFYTYFGYPLLLWAFRRKPATPSGGYIPSVSVIIAAYNEEAGIVETVETILASRYPPEALDVIVVSDASTDRTDEWVRRIANSRVQLLRQPVRSGQTAAMLRGTQVSQSTIVVMADASGHFSPDTIHHLVRHFENEKVGAVSGYMEIRDSGSAVSEGNNLYGWYDMKLRHWESLTGSSYVGCEGGLFAIRRSLFRADFPLDIAADNATCYRLYEEGFNHLFDPEAVIIERSARDLKNEFYRKVRIIVLQLRGFFAFRRLFIPWRHPRFFFQNVSHKLFRWMVPFALILMWVASAFSPSLWGHAFFVAQSVFYACAAFGALVRSRHRAPWLLAIPAYFVAVNMGGLAAWFNLFRNYTVWSPPVRDPDI